MESAVQTVQPEPLQLEQIPRWDRISDIIVVGQGIAGCCAALEAKRAGADVLVVERASGGGGASALSSGIFYLGGGTAVQSACGYEDDAQQMLRFLMASTDPLDPAAVHDFCDNCVEHFDWLERQGVPFERTCFKGKAVFLNTSTCLLMTGNEKAWPYCEIARPAPRGHKVAGTGENAGSVAMQALLSKCELGEIASIYDNRVTALVQDANGRVIGVRSRCNAQDFYFGARRAVILATGSYGMNLDLVRSHNPLVTANAVPLGIPYNNGEGLLLGQSVGATLLGMDGVIATASIYPPAQLIKGIIVNKYGERFVAEDAYHGRTASFVMEQPDQTAYLIVDSEIFAHPEITSAQHRLVDGFETVAEMEKGLGISEGNLQATLSAYNEDAAKGVDRALHKQAEWLKPLTAAPYAAFDISFNKSIYLFMTLGGMRSSRHGEALDVRGNPIPGLYAVGACSAHIPRSGKSYASGMSLGPGSYFGRRAGRHAALRTPVELPAVG
jgi:3-oxo-5alpha-steroid 4-dehydrogenase